jgi:hypothetical protein
MITGCDEDVTLVDPGPFFSYDRENAWPAPCAGPIGRSSPEGEPDRGAFAVPPPAGLAISACPNPAPPGTREIVITFRLDVRRPSVNLAIVNDRGLIVARLLENYAAEVDREVSVPWLLDGVPPGSYRAYFLAGDLESEGDLRVD